MENKIEFERVDRTSPEGIFESPKEREEFWEINQEFVDGKNIAVEYLKLIRQSERIAGVAAAYIIENWRKVQDWNLNDLYLMSHFDNKCRHFHKHSPDRYKRLREDPNLPDWQKESNIILEKTSKKNHNPIEIFNEAYLDWDGDFNVTINGECIGWLDDNSKVDLAGYIHYALSIQKEKI